MDEKYYMYVISEMEKMLRFLMGDEEYDRFSTKLAKDAFRREMEDCEDGEFKEFVLEHFDEITADCPWK